MKKKHIYKIGDLPKDMNLLGCKLTAGRCKGMYIFSGWQKGFWMKKDLSEGQVYPIFFKHFDEIKGWRVEVPQENVLAIELHHRSR